MSKIPPSVIGVVAPILDGHYTRTQLNALFMQYGFPGDPPPGNKTDMCIGWMRRANNECDDALDRLGNLIGEMMDADYPDPDPFPHIRPDPRAKINAALGKEGLSYHRGGKIIGATLTGPARSLATLLKGSGGAEAIEKEYDRAYKTIGSDPEAAVTAACAILESLCQTYLDEQGVPLPPSLTLGPLWNATAKHLGLDPGSIPDNDLKRILTGLYGLADGVAALRSHQGSAHGRSSKSTYKLKPRHARLAVHAAHTMAMFVLETWEERRASGKAA